MTENEIKQRAEEIKNSIIENGDNEEAHIMEDRLMRDFIWHVWKQSSDPKLSQTAEMILEATGIDYERWYA